MHTPFHRISIIGLGLIGGSWGLALKKRGFAGRITGCDRPQVLDRARARGVIDEAQENPAAAVSEADLVIVATPVGAILDLLPTLQRAAPRGALITDTGSTKRVICQRAREIFGGEPVFLGGHPMAGKEQSGLESADANLFRGARYAFTPLRSEHLGDERIQAFSALVESVGAHPFVVEASAHDRAVAFLSHLPQLVSTGLASLIGEHAAPGFLPLELSAGGLCDMTRLGESPYSVWRDICLTNVENIQAALDSLIEKLEDMKAHLSDREMEREFRRALKFREELRKLT
ncbi:MAG TPA: prephenate dehydrogenase/arogenate dehydrogenase family protein [Terriglobia bacterium]|nr:prephenate dehydrogenase/arogenate dehydrogenase family protein [Terriglobia bacterium]